MRGECVPSPTDATLLLGLCRSSGLSSRDVPFSSRWSILCRFCRRDSLSVKRSDVSGDRHHPGTLLFYRTEQIVDMLGNTVVTMRLYSTIYPSACYVMHTGYEEMLSDYAQMLSRIEGKGDTDIYSSHEHKLLLMAVTYRLCSIFSNTLKSPTKEMDRKIEIFEELVHLIILVSAASLSMLTSFVSRQNILRCW